MTSFSSIFDFIDGKVAHLGGMLFGYIFLKSPQARGFDPMGAFQSAYREWKRERAKKKFQVYMKKHDAGRGPWVN